MLASLFERAMKRRAIKESDPYDWEKNDSQHSSSGTLSNSPHVRNEPMHGQITQLTVAASNASGMEYTKRKTECETAQITATEPPKAEKVCEDVVNFLKSLLTIDYKDFLFCLINH